MQKVKLNIVPKGVKRLTYLSQNDNGRVVRYELFNELVPYTLDGSETITVKVVRPDGEEIVSSVPNTEEAYIDVTFNDDMSAIAGVGAGEIKITDGETVLGSHNFDINVEIDAYNGKDVVIETATGTLLSFNTEVEDNALEYESEIPYNAEGYTGLRVINSRTAPVYNKTPYLFRKTPDGSGNSCIEKLVGASVAFNQLIQYDTNRTQGYLTVTTDSSTKKVSISLSADGGSDSYTSLNDNIYIRVKLNHKYLVSLNNYKENNAVICIRTVGTWKNGSVVFDSLRDYDNLKTATILNAGYDNGGLNFMIDCRNSYTIPTAYPATAEFYPQIIDLTAFFGSSTIADYIYSLEQATAGAGVSFFKSLGFDVPYYPYNDGSLLSSKPTAKKIVGFNQWNENWELGTLNVNDGSEVASNNNIRNQGYINALPNTTYYFKRNNIAGNIFEYDSNYNFIRLHGSPTTFTTSVNCRYMRFYMGSAYGTTYNHDICVNLNSDLDGQYKPYKETIYNLGGDTLRGLFMLDSNNNIVAYGDKKTSDGKIGRKFAIVDLGTLEYTKLAVNDYYVFHTTISDKALNTNAICDTFVNSFNGRDNIKNMEFGTYNLGAGRNIVCFRDDSLSSGDGTAFKTAMSGKYLIYEVKTPTTESSTPFDNPQEAGSTEQIFDGNEYDIVDLGSLDWSYITSGSIPRYQASLIVNAKSLTDNTKIANAISDLFSVNSWSNITNVSSYDDTLAINSAGNIITIHDNSYTDVESFKASVSGHFLIYEKSSSEGIEIPLGHDSVYGTDIEYIDIDFDTTIYGGNINAVDGVLSSEYNSDGSVKPTPEIIDITPALIPVRAGDNKIFNSADGDQTIRYYNQVE